MYSFRRMISAAALLAAVSPAAHALDLFTPPINRLDGTVECHILNVGTKPIEVSAAVKDALSSPSSDLTGSTNCPVAPATIPPGYSCGAQSVILDAGDVSYCHFTTTSSKVRAVLIGRETFGGVVAHELPATK
jgi:hypothetical protein